MSLYLKSLIGAIKKKPIQPILIILTVAIATAMFFTSLCMRDIFYDYELSREISVSGSCDIKISVGESSRVRFLNKQYAEQIVENKGIVYGVYNVSALYEKKDGSSQILNLYGVDLFHVADFNDIELIEKGKIATSNADSLIIVSKSFAKNNNVGIGDSVVCDFGTTKNVYKVEGIARETGFFAVADVIVNDKGLSTAILGMLGLSEVGNYSIYNELYIDVLDGDVNDLIADFKASERFADKLIDKTPDYTKVKSSASFNSGIMSIVAFVVALLSVMLIYSSFVLLCNERLSVMAIFKSQGADITKLRTLLLSESLLYGFLGSIIGIIASFGAIAILGAQFNMPSVSLGGRIAYYPLAILFGVIVSLLAAISPIVKTSTLSLTEMLSGKHKLANLPKIVWSVVFLALSVAFGIWLIYAQASIAIYVGLATIIFTLLSVITLTPRIVFFISFLFDKIISYKSKLGISTLIVKNSKKNLSLAGTNIMFTVCLSMIIVVSTALNVIVTHTDALLVKFEPDIVVTGVSDVSGTLPDKIAEIDGVESVIQLYQNDNVKLPNNMPVLLQAVKSGDLVKLIDYEKWGIYGAEEFDSDINYVILSSGLASGMDYKIGDTVSLDISGEKRDFILLTCYDSPENIAFVNLNNLDRMYNFLAVNCVEGKVQDILSVLKQTFSASSYRALTMSELVQSKMMAVTGFIKIIDSFSYLVIIMAALGVLNNILLSATERKREFMQYISCGMDRLKLDAYTALESIYCSVIDILIAWLTAYVILLCAKPMLKTFGGYYSIPISFNMFLYSALIGLVFVTAVTVFITYVLYSSKGRKYDLSTLTSQ